MSTTPMPPQRRGWPVGVQVRVRVRPWNTRRVYVIGGLLALALLGAGSGFRYRPVEAPGSSSPPPRQDVAAASVDLRSLRAEQRELQRKLDRKRPRGSYIVIDQTNNRLLLKRGDETLLEAPCSSGSGMVLHEGENGRTWVFDTPRGEFRVLQRKTSPAWRKPDWAFVEEGKPIPKDPAERIEYGVLGEYALHFGDGYLIHGTLYERLLGRSVSHGCIRLGRDDLRTVWRETRLGTPIYIF